MGDQATARKRHRAQAALRRSLLDGGTVKQARGRRTAGQACAVRRWLQSLL